MTTPITPDKNSRGRWTSASSAQADALCNGRHLAQRDMPDIKTEQAETGNRVHAALAKDNQAEPHGLSLEDGELFDRCVAIENKILQQYFGTNGDAMTAKPVREKRYWVNWLKNKLEHSGQPDVVYRRGAKVLIIDYKTGRDEVTESPRNMQMRDLAVAVWINSPLLQEIAVAIVQPWVTGEPELCVYKEADIRRAIDEMLVRVSASNNPASARVAGELQCKYCRAKSKCSEYQKWATAIVPVGDKGIVDVPVSDWTPDQCAIFLNGLGRAEKWLADCKTSMKELLKLKADSVPGWTLKPGMRRETITNAQEVFGRFNKLGGTLEQFMDCITVGKTKLKERVASVTKEKGKALEKSLNALTLDCVEVKESEPMLKKVEVQS